MTKRILVVPDSVSLIHLFGVCAMAVVQADAYSDFWKQISPLDEGVAKEQRPVRNIVSPRDMRPVHQAVHIKPFHGNCARSHLRRG